MASIVLRCGYFPPSLPALSAMLSEISKRLMFLPNLSNSRNIPTSFVFPASTGFGKTSVSVIIEEKAVMLPV
jgi:hypothetical protein